MRNLLWLDDIRDPNEFSWLSQYCPEFEDNRDGVTWVKSYDEFTRFITDNGLPDKISFDHDLGEDVVRHSVSQGMNKKKARQQKKLAKSGYDCAKWIVEYCLDNQVQIPQYVVHSANPVGADNIRGLLNNAKKHL